MASNRQLAILSRARAQLEIADEAFVGLVSLLGGVDDLRALDNAGFAALTDHLFACGFRDPELPAVSPDYLEALDRGRREFGVGDELFGAMVRAVGADRLEHLDGIGFAGVVWALASSYRFELNRLRRSFMTRERAALLHLARHILDLPWPTYEAILAEYGGGAFRTAWLDERGFERVLAFCRAQGFAPPDAPAPYCSGPGLATAGQINLIRGLFRENCGYKDSTDEAALYAWLEAAFGFSGLQGLTRAGARKVIDRLIRWPVVIRRATAMREELQDAEPDRTG